MRRECSSRRSSYAGGSGEAWGGPYAEAWWLPVARKSKRSRRRAGKHSTRRPKRTAVAPAKGERQAGADAALGSGGGHLRWRVVPCARDWRLTAATLALLLLILFAVYVAFGHLGWVAISAVLLFGALAPFFCPTTYTLDDEGVAAKGPFGTARRDWDALRSHRVDTTGVLLSPFSHPSRLDGFRGIYLRFQDNREQVMAIVAARTTPRGARQRPSSGKT